MKSILTFIFSFLFIVSGFSQTRNVVVGTNDVIVQPTNFWSANASNGRTGLGLGSAATNPSSAFQPSSVVLSNLSSNNGTGITNISVNNVIGALSTNGNAVSLTNFPSLLLRTNGDGSGITNITAANIVGSVASASNIVGTIAISNVVNLQSSLDAKLGTNPTLAIANISNLQTTLDGKLGTNPTLQISNIAALQTALDGKLSGTFPIAISNVSGLQTSLDGKLSTNPTLQISNISGLQTNLDSKLSITGNAVNLTNFPASLLRTTGDASSLTNFPTLNQNTTGTASNVTGIVSISNGGTGTNSIIGARQNLGLVWAGLTNTNAETFRTGLGATTVGTSIFTLANPSSIRFIRLNADNTVSALIDSDFRTAIGLGTASTNPSSAFQPSSTVLSNLALSNGASLTNISVANVVGALATNGNGAGLTNITAANIAGPIAINNGGTGATNAATARTNLGLGWSALTNTNAATSLLGFTANGEVVANTGTNVLTFTNTVNFGSDFAVASPAGEFQWNGVTFFEPETKVWSSAFSFNNTTNAANTRANLGFSTNLNTLWTATNASNARSSIGLGNTNGPTFKTLFITNTVEQIVARFEGVYGNPLEIYTVDETLGAGYGTAAFAIGAGEYGFAVKFSTNDIDWGVPILMEENQNRVNRPTISNTITFIQPLAWSTNTFAATTRTNLGLGWTALTNTNAGTSLVSVDTNGEVVSPTNFWQKAPIVTTFIESQPTTNSTTNISPSRLLHIHSLATNIVNVTNIIALPTNTLTFEGDMALVVHKGPTSNLTQVRQAGSTNNLITLNKFNEAVEFTYYNNTWQFLETAAFTAPIYFSGTNASANAAASRTNLGLGATWLTNTNVTNFRTAVGLGSSDPVSFGSVSALEIYDSVGNKVIDLDSFVLGVGASASLEWATNQVQVNVPIVFYGTNTASTTRTNLGIPLAALTNTSVTNFQKAIFYTNTAPSNIGGNLGTIAAWIEIVASNGVTYKVPAYTNIP